MNEPVRDDSATARCGLCGENLAGRGDKQWCSTRCRQKAWRQAQAAPPAPVVVAKSDTVYQCDNCDARYLGAQRCDACNTWCRRLGPGGLCPCCDEPIAVEDLLRPDQFAPSITPATQTRR